MAFRPELTPAAIHQIASLPNTAMDALVRDFADVLNDPFDPDTSIAVDDSGLRSANFGGFGIVEFQPWPELGVVIVHRIIWAG